MGVIALSQVILVAFVLGFFLGHFTGSDKVTTVTEQQVQAEEQKEAKEEEEAPELAEVRIDKAKAEVEGEEKAEETAMQAKEQEAEAKSGEAEGGEAEAAGKEAEGGEGEAIAAGGAASAAGKEVFTSNCGSCHTLSEAGTTGEVGPNLDELMPEKALVETQVTNGGGVMPAFGGQLSEEEIQDVATYVSEVAGS